MAAVLTLASIALRVAAAAVALYLGFLALLTVPSLQDHVIYLHRVTLTWGKDVNVPEQWGFLRNQVTPFVLPTPDGELLHAYHVLPLQTYYEHQDALRSEPAGLAADITQRLAFQLLQKDSDVQLVIYLHGAGGTLASGWRPQSYRAISAAAARVHILAIDYRGFGSSTGWPTEAGLLADARALADFAAHTAGVSPQRTVIFGQSLGTAVAISLAHDLALREPPTLFAGLVLVAPFASVELLTETYSVAGTVPLLSPVAAFPPVLAYLHRFLVSKWPSKDQLAALIRRVEAMPDTTKGYDITLIHAKDDSDIPWAHSELLFWHAANAMRGAAAELSFAQLEAEKADAMRALGAGGWQVERAGRRGAVREWIVEHGRHDVVMSYPVVSLAIAQALRGSGGAAA